MDDYRDCHPCSVPECDGYGTVLKDAYVVVAGTRLKVEFWLCQEHAGTKPYKGFKNSTCQTCRGSNGKHTSLCGEQYV